jgi:hypothetical protein
VTTHTDDDDDDDTWMREGTPFELARQPAAGPFGATDRFDGANGCKAPPSVGARPALLPRQLLVCRGQGRAHPDDTPRRRLAL